MPPFLRKLEGALANPVLNFLGLRRNSIVILKNNQFRSRLLFSSDFPLDNAIRNRITLLIGLQLFGEVLERLNRPVSKTGVGVTPPWVRIPPSPLLSLTYGTAGTGHSSSPTLSDFPLKEASMIEATKHWPSLLTVAVFSILVALAGETQTTNPEDKPVTPNGASGPGRAVLYAAVGAELTQYDVDVAGASLVKRGSVTL